MTSKSDYIIFGNYILNEICLNTVEVIQNKFLSSTFDNMQFRNFYV